MENNKKNIETKEKNDTKKKTATASKTGAKKKTASVKKEVAKEVSSTVETPIVKKEVNKVEVITKTTNSKKDIDITKSKNVIRYIALAAVLIIIILLICTVVSISTKNGSKKDGSAIDKNSPTYQGKEITEKDGKTIIKEENNSWTIETKREKSDFISATDDIRKQYVISDVTVTSNTTSTIVKGKIQNKKSKYSKVYVNVKFYVGDEVTGSSSVLVENLKKGKSSNFEIKTLGNYSALKYAVEVEYVG